MVMVTLVSQVDVPLRFVLFDDGDPLDIYRDLSRTIEGPNGKRIHPPVLFSGAPRAKRKTSRFRRVVAFRFRASSVTAIWSFSCERCKAASASHIARCNQPLDDEHVATWILVASGLVGVSQVTIEGFERVRIDGLLRESLEEEARASSASKTKGTRR